MEAELAADDLFTEGFQVAILRQAAQNHSFGSSVLPFVKPEHFGTIHNGDYLRNSAFWMQEWLSSYPGNGSLPQTVLEQWASEDVKSAGAAEQPIREQGWKWMSWQLYQQAGEAEGPYVRDKAFEWVQKAEERRLLLDAKIAIDKGQGLAAIDFMARAREIDSIPLRGHSLGMTIGIDAVREYNEIINTPTRSIIPSGFTKLDETCSGGMARREMWLFAAPPNTGKTTVCAALAARFMLQGMFVVYYTNEQTKEQIGEKVVSNVSGYPVQTMRQEHPDVLWTWYSYLQSRGGQMLIQEYPTGSATVSDIHSHLTVTKHHYGRAPDVVIVDYPDDMKHTSGMSENRHNLAHTYIGLRGLAFAENVLMICPSQINRDGSQKDNPGMESLAECYQKGAIADGIFTICQTLEEQQQGLARLFSAKNRVGKKFIEIPFRIDYMTAMLEEQERAMVRTGQAAGAGTATDMVAAAQQYAQTYGNVHVPTLGQVG